jgi:hypothetical protein
MKKIVSIMLSVLLVVAFASVAYAGAVKGFVNVTFNSNGTAIWNYNYVPVAAWTWGPEKEGNDHTPFTDNPEAVQADQIEWMKLCLLDTSYCENVPVNFDRRNGILNTKGVLYGLYEGADILIRFKQWEDDNTYSEALAMKNLISRFILINCAFYKHYEVDGKWTTRLTMVKGYKWNPLKPLSKTNCPYLDRAYCTKGYYE